MAQVDLDFNPGDAGMLFSSTAVGVHVEWGCGEVVGRVGDDHIDLGRWRHLDARHCRWLVNWWAV